MRSGPILVRVAEAAGITARWFLRDENLDIMDRFLEDGRARAIPCFVFMDAQGEFLARWGSRPARINAARRELLQGAPPQGDPGYAAHMQRVRQRTAELYAEGFPHETVGEIRAVLAEALASRGLLRLTSLPPVLSAQTRVLILGSMPGQLSLERQQYYAHPQNQFWSVMHELLGIRTEWPYAQRLASLHEAGLGLWDVLKHCQRTGSLDRGIVGQTEVPNELAALLDQWPAIGALCFNGQKAAQAFRRHVLPSLSAAVRGRLNLLPLPSTSPAHAAKSRSAKIEEWRAIMRYL